MESKRVLMLHSFGLRFKPWTEYAQFIRAGITRGSPTPVDFHDHSLLNARLNDDKADGPFVDYLHALYAGAGSLSGSIVSSERAAGSMR